MSLLVVDASLAAAFTIAPQRTTASQKLLAGWASVIAVAPFVFTLEVTWLLLKHERRGHGSGFARRGLATLAALNILTSDAPDEEALQAAFDLAEREGLGLYDAHYLMLAIDTGATLATKDGGLVRAGRLFGVDVLDVR